MDTQAFHALAVENAIEQLAGHLGRGLTGPQVQARREQHGFNELLEKPRPGLGKMAVEKAAWA